MKPLARELRWTTLESVKWTMISLSSWLPGMAVSSILSPLKYRVSRSAKVRSGRVGVGELLEEVGTMAQLLAHEVVGDDEGLGAEDGIAAHVLDVAVGVDDDPRTPLAEPLDDSLELVGVPARLGVDDEHAVGAHGDQRVGGVLTLVGGGWLGVAETG